MLYKRFFMFFGLILMIGSLFGCSDEKNNNQKELVSVVFNASGNVSKYKTTGFSIPEQFATWTDSETASIEIPLPDVPEDTFLRVSFDACPFLAKNIKKRTAKVFVNDEFVKDSVFAYEDEHLEEKYPDFKLLVQEYHDGILLFDLMDKQVWKKAEIDTAGIKRYYDEHKDEYMWGKRVKTILITVNNDESLARAEELINMDITVDSIKSVVKAEGLKGVKVKSPFFQQGDDVDIDETVWKAGTVRVIPSTVDNTTKLIKILEVRKPEPKTYKETRGIIISAYQTKLEEDWVNELENKYPVVVNEKILNKVRKSYK